MTQLASGSGAACEATDGQAGACTAGDDACPLDVDCVGDWSVCDVSCNNKHYRHTTVRTGNGADCELENAFSAACGPGDGDCPVIIPIPDDGWSSMQVRVGIIRTQPRVQEPLQRPPFHPASFSDKTQLHTETYSYGCDNYRAGASTS